MANYKRPPTPPAVERLLRQEAGFGCAHCGYPYVEYHHIVPYATDHHFRREDMVALCGNCHEMTRGMGLKKQYSIKSNPHNLRTGMARGALSYNKSELIFKVGGSWYENVPCILRFYDQDIISCRIESDEVRVSISLFDEYMWPVFTVKDNEVSFRADAFWDFEYKYNYAVLRSAKRKVTLILDFRKPEATIRGEFLLAGKKIKLGPDYTNLDGGNIIKGARFSDGPVGIQLGEIGKKIIPANFANSKPKAKIL